MRCARNLRKGSNKREKKFGHRHERVRKPWYMDSESEAQTIVCLTLPQSEAYTINSTFCTHLYLQLLNMSEIYNKGFAQSE